MAKLISIERMEHIFYIMKYCHWFYRNNPDDHHLRYCRKGSLCPYWHLTQQEVQQLMAQSKPTQDPCQRCKGTGQVLVHLFFTTTCNHKSSSIPCYVCDGKGTVSPRTRILDKSESREWCHCENPPQDTHYYPDNSHPKCRKHCYVCSRCKGITQTG